MDIVLVTVPRLTIDAPPMGIASIKSSVEAAGFTAKTYDLNIDLYRKVSFKDWLELDSYFQTDLRYVSKSLTNIEKSIDFISIVNKRQKDLLCREKYVDIVNQQIDEVLSNNPEWIGISIFSVNSVISTIDFLTLLRVKAPTQKIVAGGMGLSSFGLGSSSNFGDYLIKNNLITTYISGEGELSITELLTTGKCSHIAPQINDLDSLPFPNYTDFDFDLYDAPENTIYITGSRGCVRKCTFCDINSLWKKFRYRSGKSLVNEMLEGYKKYKTIEFAFTDSLINGNISEFINLLDCVIDYKKLGLLPEELMFSGQFIARPEKTFPESYYKKMEEAGVYNISIGIESGSDKVLTDMRKGATKIDYDFMMEMLQKYNIRCNLLMLIGYPTETDEDFNLTLKLFKDYKKYSDSGIINGISLGKTMVILPNTPVANDPFRWGIEHDDEGNWVSTLNPRLNYKERVRRRSIAGRLCEDLGYALKLQVASVNNLYEMLLKGGYDSIS
jgi:hypothetical protein